MYIIEYKTMFSFFSRCNIFDCCINFNKKKEDSVAITGYSTHCVTFEQNLREKNIREVAISPEAIRLNIPTLYDDKYATRSPPPLPRQYPDDTSDCSLSSKKWTHPEQQYLSLIRDIIDHGYMEKGRNGNTLVKFGHSMRFSLQDGTIPILTTKRVAWKTCFEELFWFIRGGTSNHELIAKNVHIWDANSSREFLDSRGLFHREENDLGPIYGFQWRHFNADYTNCHRSYKGEGIDQLAEIIKNLKNPETRTSRRLIMTAWNPCQLDAMALPPCHIMAQFHVHSDRYLSCALYQRSGDVGLGVPFNIASYSLLTHLLARHCGLEAYEFIHFIGNCHIYEPHIEPLKIQLTREPKNFPKIRIANEHENIEDYSLDDIVWETKYEYCDAIKMAMIA